ncbi:hypothetical protein GJ496_010409 [Pomphorhynchus laevis]|nr:hypothetical protein GJ496_010409 [Pomphorhynchus laevis]
MSSKPCESRLQCLRLTTVRSQLLFHDLINTLHIVRKRNGYPIAAIEVNLSHNSIFRLSHRAVRVWNVLPQYVIKSRDKSSLKRLATSWIAEAQLNLRD